MGLGWALYEKMVFDDQGGMVNPAFRHYRIPAYADVPHSEVYFAETYEPSALWGRRAGGGAINPVAPALANALAHATGVRFAHLPMSPERIFAELTRRP